MRVRPILILLPVSLAALAAALSQRVAIADYFRSAAQPELPPAVSFEEVKMQPVTSPPPAAPSPKPPSPAPSGQVPSSPSAPQDDGPLPVAFNLAVPFTSQAPFADWDETHEETCEEASLLMVDAFYDGRTSLTPEWAEEQLLAVVAFETKQFGYFEDTTAAETALIAKKHFGYASAEVLKAPTVEGIKREILAGHPVILPAAGRELHNPYFKQPGPVYHMVVIRGWTEEGFIVNDPGTRHGEGYVYSYETVMGAMHDWDPEDIGAGAKVVLIVKPN